MEPEKMHPLILASPSADHEGGGIARPEHAASMRFLCASWNVGCAFDTSQFQIGGKSPAAASRCPAAEGNVFESPARHAALPDASTCKQLKQLAESLGASRPSSLGSASNTSICFES